MSPANRDNLPRRGEVWLVNFEPSIGGEIHKTRRVVIVSNDSANSLLNRVQVVPVSSKVGKFYPAEAEVLLKGARRKAMSDQITTASKERLLRKLGNVSDLSSIDDAIRVQLGL